MSNIIVVLGPTATGKTDHSISISQNIPAEVINADSRQIYSFMDIGTAKPTLDQLKQTPHHLISIRPPDYKFNVNEYKTLCEENIKAILKRGNTPILCGGSGQYIYSIIKNWNFAGVAPDPDLRQEMYTYAETFGPDKLYERLIALDPTKAASIDYRNIPRVVRAIEIAQSQPTELCPSDSFLNGLNFTLIGLTKERSHLYRHIDERVDNMMEIGLLQEVESLLKSGFPPTTPAFNSPGYRELISYIQGELSLEEAVTRTKTRTHTLARKQYNWFKPTDSSIHWFDTENKDCSYSIISLLNNIINPN